MSFIAPLLLRGRSGRGKTPLQRRGRTGWRGLASASQLHQSAVAATSPPPSWRLRRKKRAELLTATATRRGELQTGGLGDSGREVATGRDLVQNPKGPTPACGLFSTAWHGNFGEGTSKMPAEGQAPAGTALHGATWASWMYPKGCF